MPPTTLTKPDFGYRTSSAFFLEKSLVKFIKQLFTDTYLLDNPKVNLHQPALQEMHDQPPDTPYVSQPIYTPPVSLDPTERAQDLTGKVPPQVVRGRMPRIVTGEIDAAQLPDFPSITLQAISGHVDKLETHVGVQIFFHAYDEAPASQGYQDLTNMIEVCAQALTSYGQKGIDDAYVIILPLEWRIPEAQYFPHFIGEMQTTWLLPSARPLPDADDDMFPWVPAEHIDLKASASPELEMNLWPARNGS